MFHWSKIYDEIQGQENRGCQRGRHKPGIKEKPRRNGVGMGMRCRIKSRLCAVPAAMGFLTAVCLLATLPRAAVFARELIDTGKECSLTVKTEILVQDVEGENADWRELNERNIQVYLHRLITHIPIIAPALPQGIPCLVLVVHHVGGHIPPYPIGHHIIPVAFHPEGGGVHRIVIPAA